MTLDELEKLAIEFALRRFHNHRTRAARALGISVRTLQRKLNPNTHEAHDTERPVDEDPALVTHESPSLPESSHELAEEQQFSGIK